MDRKHKGLMYPCVKFQRASTNVESFTAVRKSDNSQNPQNENGAFSGNEAREFYESLLEKGTESCSKRNPRHSRMDDSLESTMKNNFKTKNLYTQQTNTQLKDKQCSDTRQENLFLKMAQDGDVDGLQGFIKDHKVDIDATDQFGWTALMCAAKSGHRACVRLLLNKGANVKLQNNQWYTAKDIAKQSGIQDVFGCHRKSTRKRKSNNCSDNASIVEQMCDTCGTNFYGSKKEHNASTAHLFNCQYKSERTFYHIPEDNIGFKLMKQKGWDEEKGLGPEGTGRKFPIKTVLKQDRQGIGCKSSKKAKITHFSAHDTSAVGSTKDAKTKRGLRVPRQTWKKNLVMQQEKERKWEHNLRVYMNTD